MSTIVAMLLHDVLEAFDKQSQMAAANERLCNDFSFAYEMIIADKLTLHLGSVLGMLTNVMGLVCALNVFH